MSGLTVQIDWAPSHELIVSFRAYADRKLHKTLDAGGAWVRQVDALFPKEFGSQADALSCEAGFPMGLVSRCPGERDPEPFLAWLASLSHGDLYDLLAEFVPAGKLHALGNLGALRDRYYDALSLWHERYFRTVDPAILAGLAEEARARREAAAAMDPLDLVEQVTGGVRLEEPAPETSILLVPHYHFRPLNLIDWDGARAEISYPFDPLPLAPGEVPRTLRRMVKALDDDSRLQILRFLAGGPAAFTDVVAAAGLAKSTVHHHLVALRTAGLVLVHKRADGTDRYSLRPELLDQLGPGLRAYLEGE